MFEKIRKHPSANAFPLNPIVFHKRNFMSDKKRKRISNGDGARKQCQLLGYFIFFVILFYN